MQRQLNIRLLCLLLVLLLVLGVGTHFLHAYQVKRNASALLERATDARADKDLAKTLEYLGRYLGFRPDDTNALAEYALLLEQEARTPRARIQALLALDQVLLRDPGRDRVRRRAAAVALDLGRHADAREHLELLLKAAPDDAELSEEIALCEEAASHFAKAAEWYEKAIQLAPQRVNSYVRLARIYGRRLDRPQDADAVMERLVTANPESIQARLARSAYLRDLGLLDAANQEISYAREKLAPDDADVLLASADTAQAGGKLDEARRHLERGAELHAKDPRFFLGLAGLELRAGPERRPEAVRRLRQALTVLPDRAEAIWTAADLFLDAGETEEAKKLITRLSGSGALPAAVEYLRARLLLSEDRFAEACAILEKHRPELARSPELARNSNAYLAQCYERLNNPEQRLAAFRRAAAIGSAPRWVRVSLAAALVDNGELEEAITEYRRLMPTEAMVRLTVARLLVIRNLQLPPERRHWDQVESLLKDAPKEVQQTAEYELLCLEMLLIQGRGERVRKDLEAAVQQHPKEARYWFALALLAERAQPTISEESLQAALRILDEAEKHLGDTVALRLERARRLARLPASEAIAALRKLEEGGKFTMEDVKRLRLALSELYVRLGARDDSRRLLLQVAEQWPNDLTVRLLLYDEAIFASDMPALQKHIGDIRKLEGEPGPLWRYGEATYLVLQARKGDRSGLAKARLRLAEAGKLRPRWARLPLREAEIEELEGNFEAALDRYRQAIDLGERSPQVARRTVQMLMARRRVDEAQEILQKVQERPSSSADLDRLAAELSLLRGDPRERTLELAGKAVAKDSKDYRDQLWRGQLLWSTNQRKEAEEALRRAVDLEPKASDSWVALVGFLADTGRKTEAETEIDRARAALSPADVSAAMATCYELVGQRAKAEEQHLALLKARAGEPSALRAAASFYLRGGETKKAEPVLRKLSAAVGREAEPAARWARRTLALNLATTGDYRQSRDALALIDDNLRVRPDSPEDQRARALVLALRPGGRRESIRALEASFTRLRPAPQEQLLLAELYEADRNWAKANEHWLALLTSKNGDNPAYIAHYVRRLLQHDNLTEAALWLVRLEKKDPQAPRTIEMKARVLARQGKGDEAARLLVDYSRDDYAAKKDPAVLRGVAHLLEELERFDAAERLYRDFVATTEASAPENIIVLALFLAGRDRLPEALDLCEQAWQKSSPEIVSQVSVALLRAGGSTPEQFRRIERRLEAATKQKPASTMLLASLATLREAEGRPADAVAIYRTLLTKDSRNVLALNNLAWVLAVHQGNGVEALELINRAVDIAGPIGNLLDTRGVIHLLKGHGDRATEDLEQAVAEAPTGVRWFHLAQAYLAAGNHRAAERAWAKAKELRFHKRELDPIERPAYEKVVATLERK